MSEFNPSWSFPPPSLALSSTEIHVWCASLVQSDSDVDKIMSILSEDEYQRAKQFHFVKHQRRFSWARGVLRLLLGQYLGREPRELQFQYGRYGKPALPEGAGGESLSFNVSHSGDLALYAITSVDVSSLVGIDVEYLRPVTNLEQLVQRFFSPQEQVEFAQIPASQKEAAFFRGWTCKEAFIKAIGEGLTFSLREFDVCLSPEKPAQLLRIRGDQNLAQSWKLRTFTTLDQYNAALAIDFNKSVSAADVSIKTYQFVNHF